MEDKKVLEFINKNHERAYQEYVKNKKRKNRKEKAKKIILLVIAVVCMTILTTHVVRQDQELVKECMAKGNSKDYCVIDLQR